MDENSDKLLDTKLSLHSEPKAVTNQEQLWWVVGPTTAGGARRKSVSWLASRETVDTQKFSPDWDST